MTKTLSKKGAIAILVPIFLGLIKFAHGAVVEYRDRIIENEKKIYGQSLELEDHKEMLKEIRGDIKILLQRVK